ncbi:carbohydrate phosphatase [Zopfia rhizophila CBS 207.26]|uniref:Carbohydrate phosphatase n=1 Tax=Zopfia rhizophila CBS 207.26 TaxID=1314779 RepID=A0A6A6E173_9PEZI|nr:carbohydrate phosphatase [Zopfia rhizophila CBS 207.26]
MSTPYSHELDTALHAIHATSLLTKNVLRNLSNSVSAEIKPDDSPVTIADFAAQAIIIGAVHAVFPDDRFIGEESAASLRRDVALASRVWELVSSAGKSEVQDKRSVGGTALAKSYYPKTVDEMLDRIDLGTGEQTGKGRVWVLDPIDGTATFMEGKQYAICLCLLVDGVQQVGVTGCPNLKLDSVGSKIHEDQVDATGYGVVLSAVKGRGTYVRTMHADGLGDARRVQHQVQTKDLSALDFVEVKWGKTSLSQPEHRATAESVGAEWPGTLLWSQQMKYAALTLGATDVMVRIPIGKERYTYIWDHAGGHLLYHEVGGIIKDFDGGKIDFGQGRKLLGENNFGMIAAMPWCFDKVVQAVKGVLEKRTQVAVGLGDGSIATRS